MKSPFRTLYGKLVAALLVLLIITGVGYVFLAVTMTQLYVQEVNQKLNREVAEHIVAEEPLLDRGAVNKDQLKHLFHTLMVVNPSLELYLIDPQGTILGFDAPKDKVVRERISLGPVQSFLSGDAVFPILGDDPRSVDGSKAFSVSPVMRDGELEGYLYIVLGGEIFDSLIRMIGESYILRLGLTVGAACLLISLLVGFLSFNWLTRRLRQLTSGVDAFQQGDFQTPPHFTFLRQGPRGDEIDVFGRNVEQMSSRIVDQIKLLRDADAMRKEMLTNISHDLRTPLTSLHGYLETLQMKHEQLTEIERKSYLDLAAKHAKNVSQLVSQIFELATLESGGLQPSPEPFSLSELAHDVAQKFQPLLAQKNLALETNIPEGTPYVSGDIALIERVLDNLIENAIKYTRNGGRIELSLRVADHQIATEIIDNGIGISADEIPQIFDRFYRGAPDVEGSAPKGTGLGLAIAKRILQLHNADIAVNSQLGVGSRFSFELPVSP